MDDALDLRRAAGAREQRHAERNSCLVDVVLGRHAEIVPLAGAAVNGSQVSDISGTAPPPRAAPPCEYRPMPPGYRFLDRWVVPAPIERVYDTIGDVLRYERWWTDFVIRATGDEPPPEPGKKNELLV